MGARLAMGIFFVLISLALNVVYLIVTVAFADALRLGVTEYALGMDGGKLLLTESDAAEKSQIAAGCNPRRLPNRTPSRGPTVARCGL